MASVYVPSKLLNLCIRNVVEQVEDNIDEIRLLPEEVKDKLLHLVSKRGSLSDENIGKILHGNVIEIDLSQSEVTDAGLKEVCKCKKLKKLDLNAGKGNRQSISSEGIKMLAQSCKLLEIVFLRRCELIDDSAISSLASCCSNLTQLNLEGCSLITDKSAESISKCSPKMQSLNLSRTKVSDIGLGFISLGCCTKSLVELHVGYCKDVTDNGIELIVNSCPNIRILIFHGCPLTTGRSREMIGLLGRAMRQLSWTVY